MLPNAHTFLDGGKDNAMRSGRSSFSAAVNVAHRRRSQGPNGVAQGLLPADSLA